MLTDDQRIIAAAVDVVTSVSAQLLDRNMRRLIAGRRTLAGTVVDPYALLALVQLIETHYPGVIARSREG